MNNNTLTYAAPLQRANKQTRRNHHKIETCTQNCSPRQSKVEQIIAFTSIQNRLADIEDAGKVLAVGRPKRLVTKLGKQFTAKWSLPSNQVVAWGVSQTQTQHYSCDSHEELDKNSNLSCVFSICRRTTHTFASTTARWATWPFCRCGRTAAGRRRLCHRWSRT